MLSYARVGRSTCRLGQNVRMRAFVAVLLDEPEQATCDGMFQAMSRLADGRLRRVPVRSMHLTLAFMPAVPDATLGAVAQRLGHLAAVSPVMATTIGAPRILYGGREVRLILLPLIDGDAAVARLATAIGHALLALPSVPVRVTPAPHVTLARFRRGTSRADVGPLARTLASDFADSRLTTTVDAIHLIESQLTPAGPLYTVRERFPFGEDRGGV